MDNSFKSLIESAKSILILLPTKPYFDQVASGLSLYLLLKDKKETAISCPSQMLVEFNRLVGVDKVVTELGNKNLVIKFSNYKANDIERVSYDIENGEFRLTVIPKSQVNPPEKNQLNVAYSGVSADLVVLIGGVNQTHFPAITTPDLTGVKIVHLGIKTFQAPPDRDVVSFAKPASSISELIGGLVKEAAYELNPDIATNLLMGIEEGSANFTGYEVTADTFQMVADLLRAGGVRRPKEVSARAPMAFTPPTEIEVEKQATDAPKEWIGPKIYKGTSVS